MGRALRGGLYKLLKPHFNNDECTTKKYLDGYFGYVSEDEKDTLPSKIRIDASTLTADDTKYEGYRTITRVKVNRFTGGAANGALFSEQPWIGGSTTLTIRYPKDCPEIRKLLLLALEAIDKGIFTVGGETSVGRGVFKVIKLDIDGKNIIDVKTLKGGDAE
jgi:hypothetical protein